VTINDHTASTDVAAAYAVMRYGLDALEQPITATPYATDNYCHLVALMLAGNRGADTTCYAALNLLRADKQRGAQPPSEDAIARELRDAHRPYRAAADEAPEPDSCTRTAICANAEAISHALSSTSQPDHGALGALASQLERESAILSRVTSTAGGAGMIELIRALVGPERSPATHNEAVAMNGHNMTSSIAATYAVMRYGPEAIEVPIIATLYASDIYWHVVGRLLGGAHPTPMAREEATALLRADHAQGAAPPSEHPIARALRAPDANTATHHPHRQ
jgi:hypothetical protein